MDVLQTNFYENEAVGQTNLERLPKGAIEMSEIFGLKVREDLFYVTSTDAIREDHFVRENLSKNYLGTGSCRLDQI